MSTPEDILAFWLDEVGESGWYAQDDARDATIRERFHDTWLGAMEGRFGLWLTYPSGTLAYIILLDQFSRNMFRGEATALAADKVARAAAKQAIHRGWDLKIDEPARHFFYMPLSHSENLCDQDRAVRLIKERLPQSEGGLLLHARTRRDIIRQFGRFPYRNEVLSRRETGAEAAFTQNGGYGALLRQLQQEAA